MKKVISILAMCLTLSAISQPIYNWNIMLETTSIYWEHDVNSNSIFTKDFEFVPFNKMEMNIDTINCATWSIKPSDITKWNTDELPSQTGNAGKILTTNGSGTSWATLAPQTLSISNNSLSISGGNTVILSSGTTYTAGTGISITSNTLINSAPNPTATTSAYSSGTVYNLTTTSAKLDFGTNDPVVTISSAGTYLLISNVRVDYNGLTNLAANNVNVKLRRTNNTAADLTNATGDFLVPAVTLLTATGGDCDVSSVIYTTSTNNDVIELWGSRSGSISVGNIQAGNAWIVAIKLY